MKQLLFCCCMLLCFTQATCKKEEHKSPIEQLPPATQEGKRTFGCLVNGKAWVPGNGNLILTDPPLRFVYENTNGGLFYIRAQKIITSQNIEESINIGVDSCTSAKTYQFDLSTNSLRFAFNNYKDLSPSCVRIFSGDTYVITTGSITISRFNLSQGIISGTFEFTLTKPGCETIRITEGRFDAKL